MRHEIMPFLPASESPYENSSRPAWVHYPKHLLEHPEAGSEQYTDRLPEKSDSLAQPSTSGKGVVDEGRKREEATPQSSRSLFQEMFFFCTVKNVGDVSGTGCIHVETVVDRDSGVAFAKVYSTRNAMNAVDILASRVMPFFKRKGIAIKEIHTRKTSEYCGVPLAHPFETFLATSQIRHMPMDHPGHPHAHVCEQFYRFLLKEFFPAALRKTFRLSLDELQKDLDTFIDAYNARQMNHENETNAAPHPSANFPVDV